MGRRGRRGGAAGGRRARGRRDGARARRRRAARRDRLEVDKTLRVWDVVEGGAPLLSLVGHEEAVLAVECYGEGDARRAVSGGRDKTLLVWDLDKGGAPLLKLEGHTE